MKPKVHLIQSGYVKPLGDDAKLPKCFDIRVTVGLIEYQKDGQTKYMLVDTCQSVNWPEIKNKIEGIAGSIKNVSHVLATHWHQDHMQNLKEFEGALSFTAGKTSLIGTKFYGSQQMYLDGQIEIPEIRYEVINDAHTHDDTVFIIDTDEGQQAFVGDLIYGRLENFPLDLVMKLEERATINSVKKYLWVKEFIKNNQGVTIYPGHDTPLSYEELVSYLKALEESSEWQEFLQKWLKNKQEELKCYKL